MKINILIGHAMNDGRYEAYMRKNTTCILFYILHEANYDTWYMRIKNFET